jgi:hypothetical protein
VQKRSAHAERRRRQRRNTFFAALRKHQAAHGQHEEVQAIQFDCIGACTVQRPPMETSLPTGAQCQALIDAAPVVLDDWIELGMTVQRIWLTATDQDLQLRPQMTPVIFRWYTFAGRHFSGDPVRFEQAHRLSGDFE